jgi:hypothetical protein
VTLQPSSSFFIVHLASLSSSKTFMCFDRPFLPNDRNG